MINMTIMTSATPRPREFARPVSPAVSTRNQLAWRPSGTGLCLNAQATAPIARTARHAYVPALNTAEVSAVFGARDRVATDKSGRPPRGVPR